MGDMEDTEELFEYREIDGLGYGYVVPTRNLYSIYGFKVTSDNDREWWVPESMVRPYKRFSDAELAAEFYKTMADFQSAVMFNELFDDDEHEALVDRERERMFTLESFAMRPSYDIAYGSELVKD